MQTHSRYGDGRRETLAAHLALMGAPLSLLRKVMESVTLDGVIQPIAQAGYADVWNRLCRAAVAYCEVRCRRGMRVFAVMLDARGNILGEDREGEENEHE